MIRNRGGMTMVRVACVVLLALLGVFSSQRAFALDLDNTADFDIPAQKLSSALVEFGRQTGVQVMTADADIGDLQTPGVQGKLSLKLALAQLLSGTGLDFQQAGANSLAVGKFPPAATAGPHSQADPLLSEPVNVAQATSGDQASGVPGNNSSRKFQELEKVTVTGTHNRNVSLSSPLTVLTQKDIQDSGQTDLGEVIRDLPQDFAGGQNPGIEPSALGKNDNITFGSSANLRGLGADATLTLLNGHRLAYDGPSQAIDISSIPVDAISSVQIVTDGASPIYGSDAVGGVVNVILKPDYEGLLTSARLGVTSGGGDFQQQYAAVGGHRWNGGGFIATYDHSANTALYSDERSYTSNLPMPTTLLGQSTQDSVVVNVHQDIAPTIEFQLDGTYTSRSGNLDRYTDASSYGAEPIKDVEYSFSPTLRIDLPRDWEGSLHSTFAGDNLHTEVIDYTSTSSGLIESSQIDCECNTSRSAEVDADGPLLRLPGGQSRLVMGAGYLYDSVAIPTNFNPTESGSREDYYAYGELNLPIVSPTQRVSGVYRLSLDAAGRYDKYTRTGGVAIPKVGLVYSPTADADLKISWGESFKMPTLGELITPSLSILAPEAAFGAPGSADVLLLEGGNNALNPEHATTENLGMVFHPRVVPGLRAEIDVFHINYSQRVVTPILDATGALSNPDFAQFVSQNPTPAQLAAAIASAGSFTNLTGGPYVPSDVGYLVDDVYINAADQLLKGVDTSFSYAIKAGSGSLKFMGATSWLWAKQQYSAGQPYTPISGYIFTPTNFRARFGAVWTDGRLTMSSYVNHTNGVINNNTTPNTKERGQDLVDATLLYKFQGGGAVLKGLQAGLTVQNLFNSTPGLTPPVNPQAVNYDSTNYSPIGRLVSFTLTKHW